MGRAEDGAGMSAHTPGPWHVEGQYVFSPPVASNPICATGRHLGQAIEEVEANARLIAAAPDLLGALRFILAFYEPGQRHLDTEAWKQAEGGARAAVAKAEGRT